MTSYLTGLSEEEVKKSKEKHGDNTLTKEKTKGFWRRFFENLNDPIIKVLIIALVVEVVFTFGHCNFIEIGGILAAILIATTVSTISEFGSERAFLKMQEEQKDGKVRVLRSGNYIEVAVSDIVVGDILAVSAGEKIQADGVIVSGTVKVDQSALNGESRDVKKTVSKEHDGWDLSDNGKVFRGSLVKSGTALIRVMRVGKETYYGMVARDVQTETRVSPLKMRLSHLAGQISKIGYVMAGIVGLTYLFNAFVADNKFSSELILASLKNLPFVFSTLINALTLMITVIVVAAPEGLPMMITVVLSANMKKMMKDGVLVKKLVGIETAGSMNILFTDKTGTLTQGRLVCDKVVTTYAAYKSIAALKKNENLYNILLVCAKQNTDCYISSGNIIGGNTTDRAIAEFFKGEPSSNRSVAEKKEFSSESKYSSVTFGDGMTVYKGAPEVILRSSKYALSEHGAISELNVKAVYKEYSEIASKGNRVIAVAYKEKGSNAIIFAALLILKDRLRKGIENSVSGVKRAGVQVVMLTGDGKETATEIARECSILTSSSSEVVLTSDELSEMTDEEVKIILPKLRVLARALPQDKTRLVRLSQELDLVVGMTGDGINDAPALKLADVGFAMGSGADIAKSAGDVILLDDSFFSINRTILYGRTIFKSIRKFITFQLIMNLTACGVSLIGQFMGIDSPITIIQMLWVNIIMDTLGGLAFAGEPPLDYYMKEKPKKRNEPILSGDMIHQIIFTGGYTMMLSVLFLSLNVFRNLFRSSSADVCFLTAFYALFIFAGIFNCFGARCERMWILSNIGKNKAFVFIMAFISIIQIIMIYYGGSIFRSTPLLLSELLTVILLAFSVIPFEFIRRIFYKLSKKAGQQ